MFWALFFFVNLIPEQLYVIPFGRECLWPNIYGFLIEFTAYLLAYQMFELFYIRPYFAL